MAAGLALVAATSFAILQRTRPAHKPEQTTSAYVNSSACAGCHQDIYNSYRQTGMGRSLYRAHSGNQVEDYKTHNSFYNRASDRYYTMVEHDGKLYQRRHQIGFDGMETNIVEKQIDYVIGSGNHVRSYLHRTAEGKLVEMPVSWYAENGGYWEMSPGYDRPNQQDFRRTVAAECLFCHDAYPSPANNTNFNGAEPIFGDSIPEGIDCQRCHGPGRAHIEAAGSGHSTAEAIRRTIVNPGRLSRDRQLEVCFQCHLETTSRPLPSQLPRYGREPFDYRPGRPLGDYFVHFDHSPGTDYDDSFEIAHSAYRLRKSACFRSSAMTCTTCHNPHQTLSGQQAAEHYTAVCRGCHQTAHASSMPAGANSCVDCHMPKRRTDDVVHAVMTDHYIQRRKPAGDLLAPLQEADFENKDGYRGEVMLYYPSGLPPTPGNALYLDVAQVHNGSNLKSGLPRLQQDLEKYAPARPEFYFELGEAYSKTGNQDQAVRWYEEALRRDPDFRPAVEGKGAALVAAGRLTQAVEALEKAAAMPSPDSFSLIDLGGVYLKLGKLEQAERVLKQALSANPDLPEAQNLLGLELGQKGDWAGAERSLRSAISIQPELAEAHYNLANLLARGGNLDEAQYQFQKAIAIKPAYTEAHHNYGLLLILMRSYDKAVAEFRETIRLDPKLAQAYSDLADVLAAQGRLESAAEEYRQAIQLSPEAYPAHLGLGKILARQGNVAEARSHYEKAAESPDPDVRQAALKALR